LLFVSINNLFIIVVSESLSPSLVLPSSNNNSSRNSPIDSDYYYNDNDQQSLLINAYYDYNSNIDVRSSTSTPLSDISWSSPNTNDDPSLILSNNDGKN